MPMIDSVENQTLFPRTWPQQQQPVNGVSTAFPMMKGLTHRNICSADQVLFGTPASGTRGYSWHIQRSLEWLARSVGTVTPGSGKSQDVITGGSPLLPTELLWGPRSAHRHCRSHCGYWAVLPTK